MLAHGGAHCTGSETLATAGAGALVGLLLLRPWRRRRPPWSPTAWSLPLVLAAIGVLGGYAGDDRGGSSGPRPTTAARLEIIQPTPDATMPPSFKVQLNLIGAKVVPENVTSGPLRGDEGHIHVTLDGKLISMAYRTTQDLTNLTPGPHNLQAEFVATDHAPFAVIGFISGVGDLLNLAYSQVPTALLASVARAAVAVCVGLGFGLVAGGFLASRQALARPIGAAA